MIRRAVRAVQLIAASQCRALSANVPPRKPTTINCLRAKYEARTPIAMLTAYDYSSARIADAAGVDMLLVGDSLGMVVLGRAQTVTVTMDEMLHHCRAAASGARHAFLVGDMPFGSYATPALAVANAVRFFKETGDPGVSAVKLEGGRAGAAAAVAAIVAAGMPVIGHIGLRPQAQAAQGGFRVQGRTAAAVLELLDDALALQAAGCFAIVVEGVPDRVAALITRRLAVPTIGIGAGAGTSGQVQVFHDTVGMYDRLAPRFVKRYADAGAAIEAAVRCYAAEVRAGAFPARQHSFAIGDDEWRQVVAAVGDAVPQIEAEATSLPNEGGAVDLYGGGQAVGAGVAAAPPAAVARANERGTACSKELGAPHIFVCIGGGSIGSLLTASLAQAPSHRVWVLSAWDAHVRHINAAGGLALDRAPIEPSSSGQPLHSPVRAASSVAALLAALPPAFASLTVFVAVKGARATEAAAAQAAAILSHAQASRAEGGAAAAVVVTLQNGLGHDEVIARHCGAHRTLVGTISHAAAVRAPGSVQHVGAGHVDLIESAASDANVSASASTTITAAQRIAAAMTACGLRATTHARAARDRVLWRKLTVNAAVNALTALLGVRNGYLARDPASRELVGAIVCEAHAVLVAKEARETSASAGGGPLLPPLSAAELEAHVWRVVDATAQNVSSMARDLASAAADRPTEIDAITGQIVAHAHALRVAAPVNGALLRLLKAAEAARGAPERVL